ncbi:hypothetical protein TGME49_271000 [Toxoplasma gondii ME49]|uniref:EF-hand domain-containing protein n=4 Tax=Toxoplasma gondii TaxID=5811 RepID=S8G9N9_TOXGM|nr:hypothetical protein TGME49_271000 [Toxoplasma gondii ME49]EPT28470.1 hypothetical protein TGME49_271000 [Toxoplasma gondii ME49]|eukprot:XP_018636632.1 hypothetical protein TGME49_271000 [Toxoplasma gondii ME49]
MASSTPLSSPFSPSQAYGLPATDGASLRCVASAEKEAGDTREILAEREATRTPADADEASLASQLVEELEKVKKLFAKEPYPGSALEWCLLNLPRKPHLLRDQGLEEDEDEEDDCEDEEEDSEEEESEDEEHAEREAGEGEKGGDSDQHGGGLPGTGGHLCVFRGAEEDVDGRKVTAPACMYTTSRYASSHSSSLPFSHTFSALVSATESRTGSLSRQSTAADMSAKGLEAPTPLPTAGVDTVSPSQLATQEGDPGRGSSAESFFQSEFSAASSAVPHTTLSPSSVSSRASSPSACPPEVGGQERQAELCLPKAASDNDEGAEEQTDEECREETDEGNRQEQETAESDPLHFHVLPSPLSHGKVGSRAQLLLASAASLEWHTPATVMEEEEAVPRDSEREENSLRQRAGARANASTVKSEEENDALSGEKREGTMTNKQDSETDFPTYWSLERRGENSEEREHGEESRVVRKERLDQLCKASGDKNTTGASFANTLSSVSSCVASPPSSFSSRPSLDLSSPSALSGGTDQGRPVFAWSPNTEEAEDTETTENDTIEKISANAPRAFTRPTPSSSFSCSTSACAGDSSSALVSVPSCPAQEDPFLGVQGADCVQTACEARRETLSPASDTPKPFSLEKHSSAEEESVADASVSPVEEGELCFHNASFPIENGSSCLAESASLEKDRDTVSPFSPKAREAGHLDSEEPVPGVDPSQRELQISSDGGQQEEERIQEAPHRIREADEEPHQNSRENQEMTPGQEAKVPPGSFAEVWQDWTATSQLVIGARRIAVYRQRGAVASPSLQASPLPLSPELSNSSAAGEREKNREAGVNASSSGRGENREVQGQEAPRETPQGEEDERAVGPRTREGKEEKEACGERVIASKGNESNGDFVCAEEERQIHKSEAGSKADGHDGEGVRRAVISYRAFKKLRTRVPPSFAPFFTPATYVQLLRDLGGHTDCQLLIRTLLNASFNRFLRRQCEAFVDGSRRLTKANFKRMLEAWCDDSTHLALAALKQQDAESQPGLLEFFISYIAERLFFMLDPDRTDSIKVSDLLNLPEYEKFMDIVYTPLGTEFADCPQQLQPQFAFDIFCFLREESGVLSEAVLASLCDALRTHICAQTYHVSPIVLSRLFASSSIQLRYRSLSPGTISPASEPGLSADESASLPSSPCEEQAESQGEGKNASAAEASKVESRPLDRLATDKEETRVAAAGTEDSASLLQLPAPSPAVWDALTAETSRGEEATEKNKSEDESALEEDGDDGDRRRNEGEQRQVVPVLEREELFRFLFTLEFCSCVWAEDPAKIRLLPPSCIASALSFAWKLLDVEGKGFVGVADVQILWKAICLELKTTGLFPFIDDLPEDSVELELFDRLRPVGKSFVTREEFLRNHTESRVFAMYLLSPTFFSLFEQRERIPGAPLLPGRPVAPL